MATSESNGPTGPAPGAQLRPYHRLADAGHADIGSHPAVFVDAAAPLAVLTGIAAARARLLDELLQIMEGSQSGSVYAAERLATLLRPLAEDVAQLADIIDDRAAALDGGAR